MKSKRRKLVWDIEFHLCKIATTRRPDLTLEGKAKKQIWICNMACSQQQNIEAKRLEKLAKYRQLAYESRERHPEYEIVVMPMVIGALGGGITQIMVNIGKMLKNIDLLERTICKSQKTISRKVLLGFVGEMDE